MHPIIFLVLLAASVMADTQHQFYSFSPPVGPGTGTSYTIAGMERVTAVRVWEYHTYIKGLQLRHGFVWSTPIGHTTSGTPLEFELWKGEAIVQISGKFSHTISWLVFVTNRGRSMLVGKPDGTSFNMYPADPQAELIMLSGRENGAITSIAAHWAVLPDMKKM